MNESVIDLLGSDISIRLCCLGNRKPEIRCSQLVFMFVSIKNFHYIAVEKV